MCQARGIAKHFIGAYRQNQRHSFAAKINTVLPFQEVESPILSEIPEEEEKNNNYRERSLIKNRTRRFAADDAELLWRYVKY